VLILKKVAVTGQVASGKSTVCRLLQRFGAYVLSADEIVHKLLVPTSEIGKKVVVLLGRDILVDGQLDRKVIAEKVFNNPPLLEQLEQLLHPEVQKVIEAEYQKLSSEKKFALFVAEIPLLFESHLDIFYDYILLIYADDKLCKLRSMQKSLSNFEERQSRLLPLSYKMAHSHFSLENNGSLVELETNVKNIYQKLM
jgi:dephospho-CoA kinase